VFKRASSEVEQEGEAQTRRGKVVHCLSLMAGIEFGNCFDLYDKFIVNHKIGFKDTDDSIFIGYWQFYFLFTRNPAQG
jgi:hypothetical protein